jgi:hypothetical protein
LPNQTQGDTNFICRVEILEPATRPFVDLLNFSLATSFFFEPGLFSLLFRLRVNTR